MLASAGIVVVMFAISAAMRIAAFDDRNIWFINQDAPYAVLLVMKAFAATPVSIHHYLPLVTLGNPMDKGIPWGETIPDALGKLLLHFLSNAGLSCALFRTRDLGNRADPHFRCSSLTWAFTSFAPGWWSYWPCAVSASFPQDWGRRCNRSSSYLPRPPTSSRAKPSTHTVRPIGIIRFSSSHGSRNSSCSVTQRQSRTQAGSRSPTSCLYLRAFSPPRSSGPGTSPLARSAWALLTSLIGSRRGGLPT